MPDYTRFQTSTFELVQADDYGNETVLQAGTYQDFLEMYLKMNSATEATYVRVCGQGVYFGAFFAETGFQPS